MSIESVSLSLIKLSESSRGVAQIVSEASAMSLFSKVSAIENCKSNPYQPPVIWHPTELGCFFQIDLRERVSQEIFLTGAFEPEILKFLAKVIKPGMIAYDCGAHIGFFTVAMGLLVCPDGAVHAFEPVPETKLFLDTNVRNSGLKGISTHALAVWDKEEVLEINNWGIAKSAFNSVFSPRILEGIDSINAEKIKVQSITLDEFSAINSIMPDVVKIDIESAEAYAIRGMVGLLENVKPIVILEVGDLIENETNGPQIESSSNLLNFIKTFGYEFLEFINNSIQIHEVDSDKYGYGNIICVPIGMGSAYIKEYA